MWAVSRIFLGAFLGWLAVVDIRCRKVPLWSLLAGGGIFILISLFQSPEDWRERLLGGVVGVLFLFISRWTQERFGYGDSILIVILGGFLGFWNVCSVLMIAFLCSALYAMIGMSCKKLTGKSSFAFIPFLAFGYLCVLMC